jgi:hypothetical protein
MKKNFTLKKIDSEKIWKAENIFFLKSDISRYAKFLCHYEIYKKIIDIPGDIIELGVFKGASLVKLAIFRQLLENHRSRKIYGFDNFGKFTIQKNKQDKKFINWWSNKVGNGISNVELEEILKDKKIENFELIKGDIAKTLRPFLKKNPKLRISLLHLDLDVYKPTYYALINLYNRVSSCGIILIDDYNLVSGATKAVDHFIKKKKTEIKKIKFI